MKRILPFVAAILVHSISMAQYKSVEFGYEKSTFNNGQPLPAESYFELRGDISSDVTMVEIHIYSENGYPDRKPLYKKRWQRPHSNLSERFALPLNYNLRGNSEYDIALLYFKKASPTEVENFKNELYATLDAYIDQTLTFDKKGINLIKDTRSILEDMNQIVRSASTYYRTQIDRSFDGFSDLIKDDIKQIDESRQSKFLGRKATETENLARKKELVQNLKTKVHAEVAYLLNSQLHVLRDLKVVDSYQTEKVKTIFTLHGGYGGAYFNSNQKNDLFASGFMAGLTLPLGKKQFSSPFWSNTSVMLGVYFGDFQLNDNITATGPLLKTPYYVGLGYKFYRFLRVSAGATLLENDGEINGQAVSSDIYVRPYISLTVDINLWIGLAK